MKEIHLRTLGQWDGAKDGWRARLPLRREEKAVEVDASALRIAVPTFLLRLRAFAEWHLSKGHSVAIRSPVRANVATYMARMQIAKGLPPGVFQGLPDIPTVDGSDVLIPITQLHEFSDVDQLGESVYQLFLSHSDEVAVFASAMHMAVSELCGNAVEHGANKLGCYVAAQRYESPHRRVILTLGDLGIGIPRHMRRSFRDLTSDRRALRRAVQEGVTATGKPERGIGFSCVMEGVLESQMRYATLDIHSGEAQLQQEVTAEVAKPTTMTAPAPFKLGTWATFEIGPQAWV